MEEADNANSTDAKLAMPTTSYQKKLKKKLLSYASKLIVAKLLNSCSSRLLWQKQRVTPSTKLFIKILLFSFYRKVPLHIAHCLIPGSWRSA